MYCATLLPDPPNVSKPNMRFVWIEKKVFDQSISVYSVSGKCIWQNVKTVKKISSEYIKCCSPITTVVETFWKQQTKYKKY